MIMQIDRIALYRNNGEVRVIPFRLGAVNIITGKSRTGKSAIIDIVDYCLGRSTYNIFEGVNRATVARYAVVFQVSDGQVLIAKPPPQGAAKSQSRVYMETGREIELPALAKLEPNTNDDAVTAYLSRVLGISENRTEPGEGRTTDSFEATVDHTKFYLFQEQGLVANRKLLFHRQDEQFMPQHIRDTLPYFLGAVQEERIDLVQRLRDAKRQLTTIRRRIGESESIVRDREALALALVAEAREVGLLTSGVDVVARDPMVALREAARWTPAVPLEEATGEIEQLQRDLREGEAAIADQMRRIREAEAYLREASGYGRAAEVHAHRLQAVEVVSGEIDMGSCPLCLSTLSTPTPTVGALQESLQQIRRELEGVRREEPRVATYLGELRDALHELRVRAGSTRDALNAAFAERDQAQALRDTNTRAARVAGRISMYVENVEAIDESAPLRLAEREAERRVEEMMMQLAPEEVEERMESTLRMISNDMTTWAKELDLEFAGNPYRFDYRRLTVVADTPERPIPMERQGSAENWLGCHLILMLSLHHHFISRNRPVPGLLILDQPSQVYFPSYDAYRALGGEEVDLEEVGADVVAVRRMFSFLFDVTESLAPDLQIIVMEHANLPDQRFQDALVEEPWRGERALIPPAWIEE